MALVHYALLRLAIAGQDASEARGQVVELVHADGVVPPEDRLHARELRLVAQEQAEDHGPFGAAQAVDGGLDRLRAFVLRLPVVQVDDHLDRLTAPVELRLRDAQRAADRLAGGVPVVG